MTPPQLATLHDLLSAPPRLDASRPLSCRLAATAVSQARPAQEADQQCWVSPKRLGVWRFRKVSGPTMSSDPGSLTCWTSWVLTRRPFFHGGRPTTSPRIWSCANTISSRLRVWSYLVGGAHWRSDA